MKNVFKVLGVIALAAIIVFSTTAASCGGKSADGGASSGSGSTFTSLAAFKTWIDGQRANTRETAYNVKINVANLPASGTTIQSILTGAEGKYVSLDFSGSTFTELPTGAFNLCATLTGIILPARLTAIGVTAFQGCRSLTSITIPSRVTSIGDAAFNQTVRLTSVTFQGTIPAAGFSDIADPDGILRAKYLAGGPGTYRFNGSTWTKQ